MIKDNEIYKWIKVQDIKSTTPFVKAKLISSNDKALKVVKVDDNQIIEVNK